jgi:hypothetical protein
MIFQMFSGLTGWRRWLVQSLHFVMCICLTYFLMVETSIYLLPMNGIAETEAIWFVLALGVLAGAIMVALTRTDAFVLPTLAMALSMALLVYSISLVGGGAHSGNRFVDILAAVGCGYLHFCLKRFSERLMLRGKKTVPVPN